MEMLGKGSLFELIKGTDERLKKIVDILNIGVDRVEIAKLEINTDRIRTGLGKKGGKDERERKPIYNPNFSEEMREAIADLISFISKHSVIEDIELEIKAWQPNGELYLVTSEYNKQTGFFKVNESL